MTPRPPSVDLSTVAVIIPALDEAENLLALLPGLLSLDLGQILVCDNGSTDGTKDVVDQHGVQWVYAPRRGYGAACFAGMENLSSDMRVILFMDADQAQDVGLVRGLVDPILKNDCDFVMGARVASLREAGSTTLGQRFGNWLAPSLMRIGWGHPYIDMGPFRAISRSALDAIDMKDRAYGWTIEMQIRAVELGLRITEQPVPHHTRRFGKDKIAGTWWGASKAGYWILRTCAGLWLTKRRRLQSKDPRSGSHRFEGD